MKKFIFEIEKIVNAIEKDANAKHYFLNGGCSHLANYLTPFFMKNNGFVEFATFIFYDEEWDKIQINKIIDKKSKESLNSVILNDIIIIDHIAIIHDDIIYDGHGINHKTFYEKNIMLKNNFLRKLRFERNDFVEDFLAVLRETHIFGHHSPELTKKKILDLLIKSSSKECFM